MKTKAAIAFIIFLAILTLPFIINAANGSMFHEQQIPSIKSGTLGAVNAQYGAVMPPLEIMTTHMVNMNTIKQQYGGTSSCLKCHNRADFCDKCHSYVGVKPSIG